ncbi:MAG: divergent polysaccharide deacetylase family protein [Elusimicrobia bacterium]|nr:divergent polysaccharide deacetylase family protein [Elusimicrobiota bacterium]
MKNRAAAVLLAVLAVPVSAAAPRRPPAPAAHPRVAVILDDFGLTYKANPPDEVWMKLDEPLTFAVMPESPLTRQAARATLAAGKQLIIHYPFDPFQRLKLPKDRVAPADVASVRRLLEKSRKEIPGAVGLNNHRSYRATMNRPLMDAFMKLLKPTGLYFVDARVSAHTVAYAAARAAGIPSAENYMFLDTAQVHTKAFCEKHLAEAVALARRRGSAVVIGHHYFHGTFDCLKEAMPRYAAQGVLFVHASEVVR